MTDIDRIRITPTYIESAHESGKSLPSTSHDSLCVEDSVSITKKTSPGKADKPTKAMGGEINKKKSQVQSFESRGEV